MKRNVNADVKIYEMMISSVSKHDFHTLFVLYYEPKRFFGNNVYIENMEMATKLDGMNVGSIEKLI